MFTQKVDSVWLLSVICDMRLVKVALICTSVTIWTVDIDLSY